MSQYHQAVLLKESIEGLNIQPDGIYVDTTFGGGGHSKAILEALGEGGKLYAFDQDPDALKNVLDDPRFKLLPYNFQHLKRFLRLEGIRKVDGILGDLGVSSHQFDTPERGFSIRFNEEELDMRMSQTGDLNAAKVVNTYDAEDLILVFQEYGELPATHRLVKSILSARQSAPINTTGQLKALAAPYCKGKENKYFARLFQALRMEVNGEVQALKDMLEQSAEVLKVDARLVIIAYHSIEDRLVKNFMKRGSFDGKEEKDFYGRSLKPLKTINSKPIVAGEEEVKANPRARSAKLRIAKKLDAVND